MIRSLNFIIFSVIAVLLISCDNYPQQLEVNVEYVLEAGIDSAKIVLWKGTNPALCQLEEDVDWITLDKSGLEIIDVSTTSSSHRFNIASQGETIKIAAVQKSGIWWSNLATSSFVVLPKRPGKVGILSVQVIIP